MIWLLMHSQDLRDRVTERLESGQGLAEYGLILAFTCVLCITAVTGLGGAIVNKLGQVTNGL